MRAGFVNIMGRPNAGKSTLLNALIGEKMAIVSPKVQTTRHRIRAILSGKDYQIVFSDTPGIIQPEYKLHERMMHAVRAGMNDADVCIFLIDARDDLMAVESLIQELLGKIRVLIVVNKIDLIGESRKTEIASFFSTKAYVRNLVFVSASKKIGLDELTSLLINLLPESDAYFPEDALTDMPTRFFVSELIREQTYFLYDEELPYQIAVAITKFEEREHIISIAADIIVHRESQKGIILGAGGSMIKKLGMASRASIEQFLDKKIYLELFVKVRSNWRNNETFLREYGYLQ
ncbi:MAG: GTPase Era [Chitinophagaceae bacterium]|jgi:GTP-binding protein Era